MKWLEGTSVDCIADERQHYSNDHATYNDDNTPPSLLSLPARKSSLGNHPFGVLFPLFGHR